MIWVLFALGAALSWGFYGVVLHDGQVKLGGNGMKALLFVGVAYFLIGVLIPVFALSSAGQFKNFPQGGMIWSTIGGALGAIGAACIIFAFKNGGSVTAGNAPTVNDGAAALVVMAATRARGLGIQALARIVGQATSGLPPKLVLMTPVEAVQRVAQKYLTLDNIQIVAVGDVTKVKPILEKYGKVTVYDVEGKVVQ